MEGDEAVRFKRLSIVWLVLSLGLVGAYLGVRAQDRNKWRPPPVVPPEDAVQEVTAPTVVPASQQTKEAPAPVAVDPLPLSPEQVPQVVIPEGKQKEAPADPPQIPDPVLPRVPDITIPAPPSASKKEVALPPPLPVSVKEIPAPQPLVPAAPVSAPEGVVPAGPPAVPAPTPLQPPDLPLPASPPPVEVASPPPPKADPEPAPLPPMVPKEKPSAPEPDQPPPGIPKVVSPDPVPFSTAMPESVPTRLPPPVVKHQVTIVKDQADQADAAPGDIATSSMKVAPLPMPPIGKEKDPIRPLLPPMEPAKSPEPAPIQVRPTEKSVEPAPIQVKPGDVVKPVESGPPKISVMVPAEPMPVPASAPLPAGPAGVKPLPVPMSTAPERKRPPELKLFPEKSAPKATTPAPLPWTPPVVTEPVTMPKPAATARPAGESHADKKPPRTAGLPVNVSIHGPQQVNVGQPLAFDVDILNQEAYPLADLRLHVELGEGLIHARGTSLAAGLGTIPGQSKKTIRVPVTAQRKGLHKIFVVVVSPTGQEVLAHGAVQVGQSGLSVKPGPHGPLLLDRENEIRLEVSNHHSHTLRNVAVSNVLPEGIEFVAASDHGLYRPESRTVHWQLAELAPGQTRVLGVKVEPRRLGKFTQELRAASSAGPAGSTSAVLLVEGYPDLQVKITAKDDNLELNKETVFQVRVLNLGSVPATNLPLTVILPDGMVPGQLAQGPTGYQTRGNQVVFEPLPSLNPQAQVVYTLGVVPTTHGPKTVRVQVTSDQYVLPLTREWRNVVLRD